MWRRRRGSLRTDSRSAVTLSGTARQAQQGVIVAAHQPPYLPWLGILEKIALADRFIVMDNVQYNARAFQHRTLYSQPHAARYLSLSVHSKGTRELATPIAEITLADSGVPGRHYESLRHRYGKRPGWPRVANALGSILTQSVGRLVELNLALLELTMEAFEIHTPLVLGTALKASGAKEALLVELTQAAGGTAYLSGRGASTYMQGAQFDNAGLPVYWQDFEHPVYAQSHGGAFQAGCFALEWIIEDPDGAPDAFWRMVRASGARIGVLK